MNEEDLVQDAVTEVTENTDAQTVEKNEEGIELTDTASNEERKNVKEYTEDEIEKLINDRVNTILPSKIEREKRKIEKDYRDRLAKYEETESILTAGLGTKDITESNKKMREYYEEQGIKIPTIEKRFSAEEEKILGEAEANQIIKAGYDDIKDEVNRLSSKGFDNLTNREKVILSKIGPELTYENNRRELKALGVKDEVLNDPKFKDFSSQFTSNTPIKTVYEMYTKLYQPKPTVENPGSMKNTNKDNKGVKDFYSREEALKFTREDFDKNPALFKAVEQSMLKW